MSIFKQMEDALLVAEVRGYIKAYIQTGDLVSYKTLASAMGVFSGGAVLSRTLGEIMAIDAREGQPLKSAIVVSSRNGIPGEGFFKKAYELGLIDAATLADEAKCMAFWRNQLTQLGITAPWAAYPQANAS